MNAESISNDSQVTNSSTGAGSSISGLPVMLWRRKWLIALLLVVTVGMGAAYLTVATPVYLVSARLIVLKEGLNLDENYEMDVDNRNFVATQAQVLRSPMIVSQAMKAVPGPFPGDDPAHSVTLVLNSLSTDAVQGTDVISVRYKTPNPVQGVALLREMIQMFRTYTKEETLRRLGKIGDTPRIEEELWRARVRERELSETLGSKHPELRAVQEQVPVWEKLLEDRRETNKRMAEVQAAQRVRVIEGPMVAPNPLWPRPFLLLAVCAMMGLAGGVALVWALDAVHPKLYSSHDVRTQLALPVLSRIPIIDVPWRARSAAAYRGRLVHELPGSPAAETFRALRANVQSRLALSGGRVLMVTSPRECEGKTTVVANLGLSFARLGKRTIIVDADLRCGSMHKIFEVSLERGLTSVLSDGVPLDEAIERTPMGELDLLTRGPEVDYPGELLAQPDFDRVLHLLRNQYEIVLVDTAPLLCTADGWSLASRSDGVVLVATCGRSFVSEVRRAREQLDDLGAKTLGVILNQVPDIGRYGQYSPYTSYYDSRRGAAHARNGQRTNGTPRQPSPA